MGPEMNYVGEKTSPLTFTVYPDAKGVAGMSLYEDDGVSLAYLSGVVRRTTVAYKASAAGAVIDVSAPTGSYQPGARDLIFVVRGAPGVKQVMLDGKVFPSIPSAQAGPGWSKSGDSISMRFDDDGHRRRVEIR
jgi:hypothetical protein